MLRRAQILRQAPFSWHYIQLLDPLLCPASAAPLVSAPLGPLIGPLSLPGAPLFDGRKLATISCIISCATPGFAISIRNCGCLSRVSALSE